MAAEAGTVFFFFSLHGGKLRWVDFTHSRELIKTRAGSQLLCSFELVLNGVIVFLVVEPQTCYSDRVRLELAGSCVCVGMC